MNLQGKVFGFKFLKIKKPVILGPEFPDIFKKIL